MDKTMLYSIALQRMRGDFIEELGNPFFIEGLQCSAEAVIVKVFRPHLLSKK
jgi:hypothetical protein